MQLHITFSPQLCPAPLILFLAGTVLMADDVPVADLAELPDGGTIPMDASPWLASEITRDGDAVHLTIRLPHGPDAPQETLFPAPIVVTEPGLIALPPFTSAGPAP